MKYINLPTSNASDYEISEFALSFNGYKYIEFLIENNKLPSYIPEEIIRSNSVVLITSYIGEGQLIEEASNEEIRTTLFMTQRAGRWHGFEDYDFVEMRRLIDALGSRNLVWPYYPERDV